MTESGILSPHGYPDWQPVRAVADTRLDRLTNQTANPQLVLGPYFTGNFPAVGARIEGVSGSATMSFGFYADSALTIALGFEQVQVETNTWFFGAVAVLGPYMRVLATDRTGAGTTFDITLNLHQHLGMEQRSPTDNVLVGVTDQSIGAGATRTDQAGDVWPGPAYFQLRTEAAVSTARIQYLTGSSTWNTIAHYRNPVVLDTQLLYLPAAPMRVQATNQDASARNFSYFLVAEPHLIRS